MSVSQSRAPGASTEHLGHVVMIAGAAALGGFLFGYDTSVINGGVDAIQAHFNVGSAMTGLTVSSALLGSAVGAGIAGGLADRIGRIRVMQLAAILFIVSAVGSAVPFAIWDLAVWRVIGGVAIGIASVIAPAYIAEVAPAAYRGRLASLQQLAIVLGIALSQLVNYGLAAAAGGSASGMLGPLQAWQWMLGVAAIPAVIYLVVASAIPESPRYLVAAGKLDRARAVLAKIESGDPDAKIAEISDALGGEQKPKLSDLRGKFGVLPIVWVGMAIAALQQFVGINVIFYYSSSLWQSVGIDESSSLLLSLFTSIVNIIGTLIAIALVDRIGRKPLLVIGSLGMAVSLAVTGWAFSFAEVVGEDAHLPAQWGVVALVSASAFVLFFAGSWGVVMWVLLGEMFPARVRAAALAVGTATNWVANWLVTVSFPSLRDWNLPATYFMYALFALISLVFVLRYLKETNGRSLEEMGR
ncbi:SP family sugar:H+ symporter-like MFS transporter [Saccharopolyspora erythraea NRRL 2338]|uniref:Sugar transporter, MFS superfamily n=2 Tax=Saccharopolyspora erythraea TaxID=1836 RepID=A4FQQ6_SACEN|nr:sugar porter family MFS transporter [Saccharopolyspora erythraea]EQD87669.1 major facilitator transporter [Saccharopolyspora erythraea D]PFG92983.1 SP family sugar:H+ symporter-like MFS transporter [Saccharopolyspora erythraea NRRL 2338]QRK89874.1 sugar porter family MFS transporter [Saccharopolyspora erythraea]CAM06381.1 sugar transporter, MFS superfamily [Saccharopolyspora erythraea NRRL 2338]